jgi:hypothetical protein
MPTYKRGEGDEMSWSDDLGWVEKKHNPRYSLEGPDKYEYTERDADEAVWSDDLGWCTKREHPFYRRYKPE